MRRLSLSLAATALVLAACGGSSGGNSDARATLTSAVENLQHAGGISATLTLQSTPESLQALGSQSDQPLTAADAQKILDSSLTVSSNMEQDPTKSASRVVINVAGNNDLEVRMVDQTLYLRAQVHRLLQTFGQDASKVDQLVQQLEAAPGFEFVRPFANGDWVAIRGFEQLLGQAGTQTPSAAQQKVIDDLAASLRSNATVTPAGQDSAGTHLVASVSLRDVYADVAQAAQGVQGLPAGGGLPDSSQVPDRNIEIDFWVRNGSLTQVEFDFLQLRGLAGADIPSGVSRLAARIALSDFSGDVTAPSNAVPVDLQKLLQGSLGGMTAG